MGQPRAPTPPSEALLWKARLLQKNAYLQNEQAKIGPLVEQLTRRVEEAEAKAARVDSVKDRLQAMIEDDKGQHAAFEQLDADRSKRILKLEEVLAGLDRKVKNVEASIRQLEEEHDTSITAATIEEDVRIRLQNFGLILQEIQVSSEGVRSELQETRNSAAQEMRAVLQRLQVGESNGRGTTKRITNLEAKIEGQLQAVLQQISTSTRAPATHSVQKETAPRRPEPVKDDKSEQRPPLLRPLHSKPSFTNKDRQPIIRTRTTRNGHTGDILTFQQSDTGQPTFINGQQLLNTEPINVQDDGRKRRRMNYAEESVSDVDDKPVKQASTRKRARPVRTKNSRKIDKIATAQSTAPCFACRQAHKKCSRGHPQCQRCKDMTLDCTYPGSKLADPPKNSADQHEGVSPEIALALQAVAQGIKAPTSNEEKKLTPYERALAKSRSRPLPAPRVANLPPPTLSYEI